MMNFQVLLRMLRSYYQHVSQYENSLLTKFYGLHCVKPIGGQKVWLLFVILYEAALLTAEFIVQEFEALLKSWQHTTAARQAPGVAQRSC